MGVLDDAIREHLELKRAHGADEAEVRRKEDEALGPARRSVPEEGAASEEPVGAAEPVEEALAEDAAVSGPPPAGDSFFEEIDEPFADEPAARAEEPLPAAPQTDAEYVEEDSFVDEPLPAEPLAAEPPLEPEPPIAGDEAPLVEDAAVEEDFAYDDEPLPAEPEPPLEREPRFEREPDSRLEPRSAPPADDDDVLEETPDFLQETPEHDRLWFEQKPPRDFDFDDDDR